VFTNKIEVKAGVDTETRRFILQKKKILTQATTWMKLDDIILSEMSQCLGTNPPRT
jgi:hypothetical protein